MKGRRVSLRPIKGNDISWITRWRQDPQLMRYYNRLPISNRTQVEWEVRENLNSQKRRDYMILKNNEPPVGLAYLSNISWQHRHCQVHVMLADKKSRRWSYCGIEAALLLLFHAFRDLNMHRVEAQAVEFATSAMRAVQAVGFRLECVQDSFYYIGGEYFSKYTFGLLQHEFEQELQSGKLKKYTRFLSAKGNIYPRVPLG